MAVKGLDDMKDRAPSIRYTRRLATGICERIASGESLRAICREEGMPSFQTVLRWAQEDRDGFRVRYALAMDLRAQAMAEELLELADAAPGSATGAPGTGEATARVQAEKLRVDARKWLLARMAPKRYGDRVALEHTGADGGPIQTEAVDKIRQDAEAVVAFVKDLSESVPDPELRARIIEGLPADMKEKAQQVERIARIRGTTAKNRSTPPADSKP